MNVPYKLLKFKYQIRIFRGGLKQCLRIFKRLPWVCKQNTFFFSVGIFANIKGLQLYFWSINDKISKLLFECNRIVREFWMLKPFIFTLIVTSKPIFYDTVKKQSRFLWLCSLFPIFFFTGLRIMKIKNNNKNGLSVIHLFLIIEDHICEG